MNTSLCALVRPDLKAFADSELPPFARLRARRHLKTCPDCQEELIQMQTLSEELKPTETEPALEPELRAKILASAPVSNPAQSAETLRRRRRVARKKTVLALGAASLAGGLLWVGAQNGGGLGSSPSDSASISADSPSSNAPSGSHTPSVAAGAGSPSSSASGASSASDAVSTNAVSPARAREKARAPIGAASSAQQAQAQTSDSRFADGNVLFADGHVRAKRGSALANERFAARPALPGDVPSAAAVVGGDANGATPFSIVPSSRAIHREGSVAVAVADAEQSSNDVQDLVKKAGGFVANTALETGANGRRTSTLDCRVPVDKFEAVVSKIGLLGTVTAKSLSGQDITAQVAQSGARRQALQQELSIAQARLAQKEKNAKKREAGQIFELRSDVRQVRLQAAQARAQLETWQKYGNTSSLFVSLQDRAPVKVTSAGLTDSFGPSGSAAWNSFLRNARVPFQLLLLVLAYLPIWLPALLLWRKFGRKWLAE